MMFNSTFLNFPKKKWDKFNNGKFLGKKKQLKILQIHTCIIQNKTEAFNFIECIEVWITSWQAMEKWSLCVCRLMLVAQQQLEQAKFHTENKSRTRCGLSKCLSLNLHPFCAGWPSNILPARKKILVNITKSVKRKLYRMSKKIKMCLQKPCHWYDHSVWQGQGHKVHDQYFLFILNSSSKYGYHSQMQKVLYFSIGSEISHHKIINFMAETDWLNW